ncbi:hypothetical protein B0G69_3536 [Paraburkholderia sp. RAU2J]|nr:hypothetical protein B0G69_3536 [Paraburkholderia sp. RAU2J]
MFSSFDLRDPCERSLLRTGVRPTGKRAGRAALFQARPMFASRHVGRARGGPGSLGRQREAGNGGWHVLCFCLIRVMLARAGSASPGAGAGTQGSGAGWHKNEKCGTRNHTLSCAESMAKPSRPSFVLTQVVCALRRRVAFAASGGRRMHDGSSACLWAAVMGDHVRWRVFVSFGFFGDVRSIRRTV